MAQSKAPSGQSNVGDSRPAPRIQDVARRAGVVIGTVGYDHDHFGSESNIPVSTVSQPGHRMGELAVELLLTEIRQPADHAHQTLTLDPHLIPRRSTQQGLRT
jgi:DNA-binding LacI/PurR family transcriptional regulator